jgi:hypothetical protein
MTQESHLTPLPGAGARESRPAGPRRGPPQQVRLLLPVWGEQFIVQFLRVSLPTLLAPGNLPAVAAALPTTFVFLTNSEGAELLRNHPATLYLQSICDVEFDIIDDLITGDNYSTTLTLAYARAVRATGAAMLDTCFFFLISDYIMADGSLLNVVSRIQAGADGVLAGNFQVVEEDAKGTLLSEFDSEAPSIVIKSRELMAWAMNYLHPMTLANTVNFPMYFSLHSNRLFWRVDENTLIGRFYLMHMIAIRPEVAAFQVGSSCDYSFIPEMCPSDNIHVMTDSDEYLVVEMQKRSHENRFIKLGAVDRSALAASLAEWTTERHRKNAHHPVVYRASETSSELPRVVAESREFIEAIEASLPPPQPYRDHPYWIGAIAAHRREVWKRRQKTNPLYVPNEPPQPQNLRYRDFLYQLRDTFLGRPPQVRPWHPRWPDYHMIAKLAEYYFSNKSGGRSLVLSSTSSIFQGWLKGPQRKADSLDFSKLLEFDAAQYERLMGRYDGCLLVVRESELPLLRRLLRRIAPLLSRGDHILVFVLNGHGLMVGRQFNQDILRESGGFLDRHLSFDKIQFVMAGRSAWTALRGLRSLFGLTMQNPFYLLITAVPIAFLILASVIGNFIGRGVRPRPFNDGLCSSVGVVMRVVAHPVDLPEPVSASELELAGRRFEDHQAPATSHQIQSV